MALPKLTLSGKLTVTKGKPVIGQVDNGIEIHTFVKRYLDIDFPIRTDAYLPIYAAALPVYADDTAAGVGGLTTGQLYKTAAGVLMTKN